MTESDDLREALRQAEARIGQLREGNAALERTLLRPTALRRAAVATFALAALATIVAYAGATRLVEARAARERELSEEAHALAKEVVRRSVESCWAVLQKTAAGVERCKVERDELVTQLREDALRLPSGTPPCPCEPADPLCSCF